MLKESSLTIRISNVLILSFLLTMTIGCSAKKEFLRTETPDAVKTPKAVWPTPPALTDGQLLGVEKVRGLSKDEASGQFALKDVMEAYWKLKAAAAKDGWDLKLVSGYRSFGSQRRIWNKNDRRWQKDGVTKPSVRVRSILKTVTMPGLSRHHWGTELDISEKTLRGHLVPIGPETPPKVVAFYDWMEANGPKYGFCRVYLGKRGVIVDEPWHWSYFPFSRSYHEQFLGIRDFSGIMNSEVAGVDYLLKNFGEILDQAVKSVDMGCFP